ncbi:IclR family transcriptional regulator [Amphritea sp.]|uniref:IclR family transcriptional regulator n=1 Tax=Amphritea sp. TaxID=1872502 RepID=UPI003D0D69F6
MTSPARVFAILDMFSREAPVWSPDDINERLGYTRATGYRYVKELVEAGYLQKVSAGLYALGPRIIELDYQLRQSDPLLLSAAPCMEQLGQQTGFDVVLSVYFSGSMQVIDTHRYHSQQELELTYGRGRPRPLFFGAAPKILAASLTKPQQKKLYSAFSEEISHQGLGNSLDEFYAILREIKQLGYYISRGELDTNIGGIAMSISSQDKETSAVLALVGSIENFDKANTELLCFALKQCVAQISAKLNQVGKH